MAAKKRQARNVAARPAAPPPASPFLADPRRALLLVLAVGLVVRIAYLWLDRNDPFFAPVLLDAAYYHEWAERIRGGDLWTSGVFYGLPLYPYFLALCYALTGGSVVAVKLVQIALGLVTIFFTFKIGEHLADATTGLVAASLAALYGPLFFFEAMLIPEALGVPLYAAGFYHCLRFVDAPTWRRGVLAGALLGLACLTKAGVILFVVLFSVILLLRSKLAVVAFAAAFFAMLAPVTLHNRLIGGDWVFLTSHAGLNFYIGNNPDAEGVFRAPAGTGIALADQIADSRAIAETAAGRALRPSEVSAYWSEKARAFIREQPLRFVTLSARKLLLAFDARELSDLQDYGTADRFNPLMRVPWPSFAILGPLAVAGILLAPPRRQRWVLVLWILTYLSGLATFFVNARYRLPLLSVGFVLAALALVALARQVRARAWQPVARFALVIAVAVGVSRLALVPLDHARDYVNAGNLRLTAKDYAGARAFYDEALAIDPTHAQASLGMGIVLAKLGRSDEAGAFYAQSVASSPDPLAYNNLGTWHQQRGELDEAERAYERAVELKPHFAKAHDNLGIVYSLSGDQERAIASFETALRLDPKSCAAETNLGLALRRTGRDAEAREHWTHALAIDPACEGARRALASAGGGGHDR